MKWPAINIITLLLLVLPSTITNAQRIEADSILKASTSPNYLIPIRDIATLNLLINRYDVYIYNVEWARVSPSSWWTNINRGFMTDGDNFTTNWFGHPYHGSLFYNAARTSNLSYLQSIPYVLGGSLMWEYFGETEPPSEIDVFTTTFGGLHLGEIFYRLSDNVYHHPNMKSRKTLRKLSSGLLNPVAGLKNLLWGYEIPETAQSLNPISARLYFGSNHPFDRFFKEMYGTGATIHLDLNYGSLINRSQTNFGPFDYFNFKSWITFQSGTIFENPYFNITSQGILLGTKLINNPGRTHLVSISQHYDFIHNELFKIGSIVLTGDYWVQRTIGKNRIIGSAKVGVVLFGSGNSEMVRPVETEYFPNFERDYIYGQGLLGAADLMVDIHKQGIFTADFNHFRINSHIQPEGIEYLNLLRVRYLHPIYKNISFGAEYDYYRRNAIYYTSKGFDRIKASHEEAKLLIGVEL